MQTGRLTDAAAKVVIKIGSLFAAKGPIDLVETGEGPSTLCKQSECNVGGVNRYHLPDTSNVCGPRNRLSHQILI